MRVPFTIVCNICNADHHHTWFPYNLWQVSVSCCSRILISYNKCHLLSENSNQLQEVSVTCCPRILKSKDTYVSHVVRMSFFDQYLPVAMIHHLCLSLSILSYWTIRIKKFNKCSVSVMLIAFFSLILHWRPLSRLLYPRFSPNYAKWRHKITIRWRHWNKKML